MLAISVVLTTALHDGLRWLACRRRTGRHRRGDLGQATAEYALVLLGAATVALLFVAWAARSGKVSELLDAVVDKVLSQV